MPEGFLFIAASLLVIIPVAFITPSNSTIPLSVAIAFSFISMREVKEDAESLTVNARAMFIDLVNPAKQITIAHVRGIVDRLMV